MALRKTERSLEADAPLAEVTSASGQQAQNRSPIPFPDNARRYHFPQSPAGGEQSERNVLQALLSLAALHTQLNKRKALADSDVRFLASHLEEVPKFALDETLQLIADRAVAITGAHGSAIAIAENNEIVLRAAAGTLRPEMGARIDCSSVFSRICLRTAQIVSCEDTEIDQRVNLEACRSLGVRSMVAVPLPGRHGVIGLLETFSALPLGFSDRDIHNLKSLAELVQGSLTPGDEDRRAESVRIALAQSEPVEDRTTICATEAGSQEELPLESSAPPKRLGSAQSA